MLDFIGEFFAWYNLIFTVPIILIFFYILLHLLGIASHAGGDSFFLEISDLGVDADDDMDYVGLDADESILSRLLDFVNVGETPLMMLIAVFLLMWGITGFTFNHIIISILQKFAVKTFWAPLIIPSLAIAFVVSIMSTKLFAKVIAIVIPTSEKGVTSIKELVGKTARVISGEVTTKFGRARLRDNLGNSITVFCKIRAGEEMPKIGDEVILLDYDDTERKFEVEKFDVNRMNDIE